MNDDFSELRVSLFALNQFVSWIIIVLLFILRSSIEFVWKNIVVSSAKSRVFPSVQHLCKSFMNKIKERGPSTEPFCTQHFIGWV